MFLQKPKKILIQEELERRILHGLACEWEVARWVLSASDREKLRKPLFSLCDMNGKCEDHPDDGIDFPAICQDYTTEPNGGHLGSVSSGKIRIIKAFWVLLARIAGWNP